MPQALKEFIAKLNSNGIPLLLFQDYRTGLPSITFTFYVVSGVMVLLGLVGKAAGLVGGIDLQQALYWYLMSGGLYLGRRIGADKSLDAAPDSSSSPTPPQGN